MRDDRLTMAIFRDLCPSCGGDTNSWCLRQKRPCLKCLHPLQDINSFLEEGNFELLGEYGDKKLLEMEAETFNKLFSEFVGGDLWSAQRAWFKRAWLGRSFAITAPTGLGKTVFSVALSLFLAERDAKTYIILPTTTLVQQVGEKLQTYIEREESSIKVAWFHSSLPSKKRRAFIEALEEGDFDILITTSKFLSTHLNDVKKAVDRFDLVIVDDVDALLKASKNIDRVLLLLGFNEEIVLKAWELTKSRRNVYTSRSKKLRELVEELEQEIDEYKAMHSIGQLIVSSATGRVRGRRVRLFRELLNFEIGSVRDVFRNVEDTYIFPKHGDVVSEVVRVVEKLGEGGLIFVPVGEMDLAYRIVEELRKVNVSAEAVVSEKGRKTKKVQAFASGEVDVLVGSATTYGLLVRGLDYPERIRYAVFAGIPKYKYELMVPTNPFHAISLLTTFEEVIESEEKKSWIGQLIRKMKKSFRGTGGLMARSVEEALVKGERYEKGRLAFLQGLLEEARKMISELLRDEELIKSLKKSKHIALLEEREKNYVLVPDVNTYIQGSGRTSRLFLGGVTKGLSVVVIDYSKLFRNLMRRTEWLLESSWQNFGVIDLQGLFSRIEEDRSLVLATRRGKFEGREDMLKTCLFIVESPSKAKSIAYYFGRPSRRIMGSVYCYEVLAGKYLMTITATVGHVIDLITKSSKTVLDEDYDGQEVKTMEKIGEDKGDWSWESEDFLRIMMDIDGHFHGVKVYPDENIFLPIYGEIKVCRRCNSSWTSSDDECPTCGSSFYNTKLDVIRSLQQLALEVDEVVIGTDPDTEGEKIGWDIATAVYPYANSVKRAEFREVTRRAILEALENLRDFDEKLVQAQIVRRIEDRWLGFELSRKVWEKFGSQYLSAGRVQTPVLGWIVELAKKYAKRIETSLVTLDNDIKLQLDGKVEAEEVYIGEVECEEVEVSPPPPFTTDSLLLMASKVLRLTTDQTMKASQDLFEAGLITYHRTDSIRVSSKGINVAKEYIETKFGKERFQGRSWGTGGAHECIRPTKSMDSDELSRLIRNGELELVKRLTSRHYRVYDLISRRFFASQMKPAKVLKQAAKLRIGDIEVDYEGVLEEIDKGWLEVQPFWRPFVPKFSKGQRIKVKEGGIELIKRPGTRMPTQGELVAMMKEKGIGRPSTYANVIRNLLRRRYFWESLKSRKLVPTKLGRQVYEYLSSLNVVRECISEERTRYLQTKMDAIAEGRIDYIEVLSDLFAEVQKIKGLTLKQRLFK